MILLKMSKVQQCITSRDDQVVAFAQWPCVIKSEIRYWLPSNSVIEVDGKTYITQELTNLKLFQPNELPTT